MIAGQTVHVYAYGAALAGVSIPDGGARLRHDTRCVQHALPAPDWRWTIDATNTSSGAPDLELVAADIPCLAPDPALRPVPSDAAQTTCRALTAVHEGCTMRIDAVPNICLSLPQQARPTWAALASLVLILALSIDPPRAPVALDLPVAAPPVDVNLDTGVEEEALVRIDL